MIEVTKPRAIALGYFDGVHLGHRALMQRAVERAKQIGGTSGFSRLMCIRIRLSWAVRCRC